MVFAVGELTKIIKCANITKELIECAGKEMDL